MEIHRANPSPHTHTEKPQNGHARPGALDRRRRAGVSISRRAKGWMGRRRRRMTRNLRLDPSSDGVGVGAKETGNGTGNGMRDLYFWRAVDVYGGVLMLG